MKQLHGNSSRFVRELTPEERAFISKRVKSTDRNIRDRVRGVDLSSEGYSVPQIMEELKRDRNYVLRWIDWFNLEGIEGFETKKRRGRPKVYAETEEQKVITIVSHFTPTQQPPYSSFQSHLTEPLHRDSPLF